MSVRVCVCLCVLFWQFLLNFLPEGGGGGFFGLAVFFSLPEARGELWHHRGGECQCGQVSTRVIGLGIVSPVTPNPGQTLGFFFNKRFHSQLTPRAWAPLAQGLPSHRVQAYSSPSSWSRTASVSLEMDTGCTQLESASLACSLMLQIALVLLSPRRFFGNHRDKKPLLWGQYIWVRWNPQKHKICNTWRMKGALKKNAVVVGTQKKPVWDFLQVGSGKKALGARPVREEVILFQRNRRQRGP